MDTVTGEPTVVCHGHVIYRKCGHTMSIWWKCQGYYSGYVTMAVE